MSDIQRAIDKQAKLDAEATDGPWPSCWHGPCTEDGEPTKHCAFGPMHEGDEDSDDVAMDNAWADARLIAHLRNQAQLARAALQAAFSFVDAHGFGDCEVSGRITLEAALTAWADHVNGEEK